jgi:hypothetical protein
VNIAVHASRAIGDVCFNFATCADIKAFLQLTNTEIRRERHQGRRHSARENQLVVEHAQAAENVDAESPRQSSPQSSPHPRRSPPRRARPSKLLSSPAAIPPATDLFVRHAHRQRRFAHALVHAQNPVTVLRITGSKL